MLDPSQMALFVGAALLLLVVPGPAVLYIVTQSVSHGRRAGLASVAGITTGTLVHIAAATVGLSALLASSAVAFNVVKYLGAAYLIVVGIRRLAGLERPTQDGAPGTRSRRQPLPPGNRRQRAEPEDGAVLPRVPAPVHRSAQGAVWAQILVLGLIFACLGALSDGCWALVAGRSATACAEAPASRRSSVTSPARFSWGSARWPRCLRPAKQT